MVNTITGPGGYLDIAVKSGLGALLIAVLLLLARGRHYILSGLLVSMPVISIYTWWWIGAEHGVEPLHRAVHAAMWGAVPWLAYLGVVYLLAGRLPLWLSLAAGAVTWLIVAFIFALILHARG